MGHINFNSIRNKFDHLIAITKGHVERVDDIRN